MNWFCVLWYGGIAFLGVCLIALLAFCFFVARNPTRMFNDTETDND